METSKAYLEVLQENIKELEFQEENLRFTGFEHAMNQKQQYDQIYWGIFAKIALICFVTFANILMIYKLFEHTNAKISDLI